MGLTRKCIQTPGDSANPPFSTLEVNPHCSPVSNLQVIVLDKPTLFHLIQSREFIFWVFNT